MTEIGKVKYEERFKQPLLFEGMTFDKIYPTDIDAITEYHNHFFIIMEVKGEGVPLSYGQLTALQRIVDALQDAKKDAVLFVCRHNVEDRTKPVLLRDTIVSEAYYNRQWYKIQPKTAGEVWFYAMERARRKEIGYGD